MKSTTDVQYQYAAQDDLVSRLPLELSIMVFGLLGMPDLFSCAAVNRCWRERLRAPGSDHLYARHLRMKYNHLTCGQAPLGAQKTKEQLLQDFPRLSATDYYQTPGSFRELALRDLQVRRNWESGIPTRRVNLNRGLEHTAEILSVVIDPVYGLIITGDRAGQVVFWSTRTEGAVKRIDLDDEEHNNGGAIPAIAAMALDGDHLVIGTWYRTIHILRRDPEDAKPMGRAFTVLASVAMPSEVISISLVGNICIAGCNCGAVEIWDIGIPEAENNGLGKVEDKSPSYGPQLRLSIGTQRHPGVRQCNVSLCYRKPVLYTSSTRISMISPRIIDPNDTRELWEYETDDIVIKEISSLGDDDYGINNLCILQPFGDQGDLLVAWSDMTVCNVEFSKVQDDLDWYPDSQLLIDRAHGNSIRALAVGHGIIVTGSWDRTIGIFKEDDPDNRDTMYSEVGRRIAYGGDVNAIAMDPCFFVSVSDDRSVVLHDFKPPGMSRHGFEASLAMIQSPSVVSASTFSETASTPSTTPPSSPSLRALLPRKRARIE